jgi:hypothetical protein
MLRDTTNESVCSAKEKIGLDVRELESKDRRAQLLKANADVKTQP